jgi:methyl-accepting chemotaxis protein
LPDTAIAEEQIRVNTAIQTHMGQINSMTIAEITRRVGDVKTATDSGISKQIANYVDERLRGVNFENTMPLITEFNERISRLELKTKELSDGKSEISSSFQAINVRADEINAKLDLDVSQMAIVTGQITAAEASIQSLSNELRECPASISNE